MGHCWLIQKPWRSCLPSGSLLWWWLSWASTAQASPTWWTSWLGRTRVSDTSRAQPSPFCPPTLPACSTVMWGEEVRDPEGILKANFQSTVMFLSSLWPERISSPLFTLCLSFCFKSINCSFPRKTNVVIKIGNVYNNKLQDSYKDIHIVRTFSTDFYVKPVSCSCQNHVVQFKLSCLKLATSDCFHKVFLHYKLISAWIVNIPVSMHTFLRSALLKLSESFTSTSK